MGARAPSEYSTTNWKFTIEVKAKNAWKVVEPNHAPSKSDLTINLRDKHGVIMCASWNGNDGRGWILMMRSFGCRSRELCISASEFDNKMLVLGLMKVTISHRRLNASLVSKILSARFASSDGLAIEMIFDDAQPDSCELRHMARAANSDTQLDSC